MAPAKNDLAAKKAAKQKKIVIGGSIILIALLAFQVPRTLKMMHPTPAPSLSASTATTSTTETAPAVTDTGATAAPATPTAAPSGDGTLVLTAELSPAPREGQLAVFTSSFTSKDPFKQQLTDKEASGGGSDKPKGGGSATPTPLPTLPGSAETASPLLSATITVNGVAEGVNLDADFPLASPLFHLVALTATTAKISIAGGSLATGSPTITLKPGKTVTLMNTADGTRYQITLVAMSTKVAAAPVATTATVAPTAAPTTTTTTTTTTTPGG